MKKYRIFRFWSLGFVILSVIFMTSCNDEENNDIQAISVLTQTEKDALIFMIEEEKLARDAYAYLYEIWNVLQFQNIKQSEQSHMDAVENLLKFYEMEYTISEVGIFENTELQNIYNSLVAKGETSLIDALVVGATIEDLDIKDLEDWMLKIDNSEINAVFEKLQCGSRNHLRAFTNSLDIQEVSYTPQYITKAEYDLIIDGTIEQCN